MHRVDLQQTDSTNTQAAALLREHDEPVLVTAVTQTAGRGRWGRDWQSPQGGAWFSLGLHVPAGQVNELVSIDAAHAVRDALGRWIEGSRLTIKPPNDVLLDEKKVAGILCEQTIEASSSPPSARLVVGVGVNVNLDTVTLGNELRRPAVSLSEALGREVPVGEVIDACVVELMNRVGRVPRTSVRASGHLSSPGTD